MVSEDQSEGLERASMQLMCLESQIRGSPGKSWASQATKSEGG